MRDEQGKEKEVRVLFCFVYLFCNKNLIVAKMCNLVLGFELKLKFEIGTIVRIVVSHSKSHFEKRFHTLQFMIKFFNKMKIQQFFFYNQECIASLFQSKPIK